MIKVGMIGYNDGNGHPYSFSAIINGYNREKMSASPYPGIARYLSVRKPEEFGIGNFKVTHVWTPYPEISKSISECSLIKNIVNDYRELKDEVDVVIIARDDVGSHREIAGYFLEAGIITFVDKPLCGNLDDLAYYKPFLENALLMSCSGFRYFPKITSRCSGELDGKQILFSHSVGMNDWLKYGIHLLEGVTPVMGTDVEWVQNSGEEGNAIVRVQYKNGSYSLIQVNARSGFVLRSGFYTTTTHQVFDYDDNFTCFRELLLQFHQQVITKKPVINPLETETILRVMIAAEQSRAKGGERIYFRHVLTH